jgi:hypothetical protein
MTARAKQSPQDLKRMNLISFVNDKYSLNELINCIKEELKLLKYPDTKAQHLKKRVLEKDMRELLELKKWTVPIIAIIMHHVEYKFGTDKIRDVMSNHLERQLVLLNKTNISVKSCEEMAATIQLFVAMFPVTIWKHELEYTAALHMNLEQVEIFALFWSIFTQMLHSFAKTGKKKLTSMRISERQKMADQIKDAQSFIDFLNKEDVIIPPIDVVLDILELKGLSYKFYEGLPARNLFIRLFVKHDGVYDKMMADCSESIRGGPLLKKWLANEANRMNPAIIDFALRFCRTEFDTLGFSNPMRYCEDHGIKCRHSITKKPSHDILVAELETPVKHNGKLIIGIAVANLVCSTFTDINAFDPILQFEKMYMTGKIAVVCALGVYLPKNYKTDIIFIDPSVLHKFK